MTKEKAKEFIAQSVKSDVDMALVADAIKALEQEPKTEQCKNCKWWKDSDGAYRRGIGAESKCPMNTQMVRDGLGYCYRFEPKAESDGKEMTSEELLKAAKLAVERERKIKEIVERDNKVREILNGDCDDISKFVFIRELYEDNTESEDKE